MLARGWPTVSVPGAVATGSRSPSGFLRFLLDPVATALGTDTQHYFILIPS